MALLTLSRGDKRLVDLPTSWSNQGRHEQLQKGAAESFSNLVALAVAKSGSNFQLYDALRPIEEQIELLKRNYRRVSRGRYKSSDRSWDGSTWEKRAGRPNTASPGWSNHGSGLAVDIHPGPIQDIFKSDGPAWGWSWAEGKRNGESWHFVYVGGNRYASRGWLDHGAVQKVVGADVDGKIGTGTVKLIKAWQKKHGLEADGIVGPGTAKAMGLGKGDAGAGVIKTPKPAAKPDPVAAVSDYKLDKDSSPNAYNDRKGHSIKHITVHWWGTPVGQKRGGIVSWLTNPKAEVSAHYVVSKGHVTQLVEEDCGSWANGNKTANLESITIECDPNDPVGTLPTVAALIADIRGRHGNLPIYPHSHWVATECPGAYRDLLPELDAMANGGTVNLGRPVVTPAKRGITVDGRQGRESSKALQRFLNSRVKSRKLKVDGRLGPDTYRSLQEYLGHPVVDGLLENQSYKPTELGNGVGPHGWEYVGRGGKGSKTVRRLQKWVGVEQDGVWYEGTTRALQVKLNDHGFGG